MAVSVRVGERWLDVIDYRVEEEITPFLPTESGGGIGSISLTLDSEGLTDLLDYRGEDVTVQLPEGRIDGEVLNVEINQAQNHTILTCATNLKNLLSFNVTAPPLRGTLRSVVSFYCSELGRIPYVYVDEALGDQVVAVPGWFGNLWERLRDLAQAYQAEFYLTPVGVGFRPVRSVFTQPPATLDCTLRLSNDPLAQEVEVTSYPSEWVTDQLVYPPGGWTSETQVLTVNSKEVATYTLELSTSVASIVPPVPVTFVGQHENGVSVYSVVADDGLPVQPAQWVDAGGSVSVAINPDTTSLTVTVTGPSKPIITATGVESRTFSLSLASDTTGNRYSTLRIIGTGVRFEKTATTISTGLSNSQTGTVTGASIDNLFLGDMDKTYGLGSSLAREYQGNSLTGSLTTDAFTGLERVESVGINYGNATAGFSVPAAYEGGATSPQLVTSPTAPYGTAVPYVQTQVINPNAISNAPAIRFNSLTPTGSGFLIPFTPDMAGSSIYLWGRVSYQQSIRVFARAHYPNGQDSHVVAYGDYVSSPADQWTQVSLTLPYDTPLEGYKWFSIGLQVFGNPLGGSIIAAGFPRVGFTDRYVFDDFIENPLPGEFTEKASAQAPTILYERMGLGSSLGFVVGARTEVEGFPVRINSATTSPTGVNVSFRNTATHGDFLREYGTMSYSDFTSEFAEHTYTDIELTMR